MNSLVQLLIQCFERGILVVIAIQSNEVVPSFLQKEGMSVGMA